MLKSIFVNKFSIFPDEFNGGYGNHDDCIRMPVGKHYNKKAYLTFVNDLAQTVNQRVEMVFSENMRELLYE